MTLSELEDKCFASIKRQSDKHILNLSVSVENYQRLKNSNLESVYFDERNHLLFFDSFLVTKHKVFENECRAYPWEYQNDYR